MKLLAWDTSAKAGSLAALECNERDGSFRLVSEWTLNIDAVHSERLLWSLHELLEASRWKLEDVDLFGVGVGPGSFTGLRIGVTTARTLAHALKKTVVGVSSLAALARPAALHLSNAEPHALLVAATDACKGELFALYGQASALASGILSEETSTEEVIRPESLVKSLAVHLEKTGSTARWALVGEGRNRYLDQWEELPAKKRILLDLPFGDQVQGRYVGILAWEAYQAGQARAALDIHPKYLRASDAELKLKAGLLPSGPSRF